MYRRSISKKLLLPQKSYSEAFKKQVVREYESGFLNKDQLRRKYNLGGKCTILYWCRKYGRFAYTEKSSICSPMKDPQKEKIRQLEEKLKQAELKIKVYDKLIEITNRQLDQDTLKKIEAKLSESLRQKDK